MGKTVLITGASQGIGKAEAIRFAQGGYNVILNYNRSAKQAESLQEQLTGAGHQAIALRADVAVAEQVAAMVESAQERFGNIDVLINNAGIGGQKVFQDITEKQWDRMFAVNVKGCYNCIQAVLKGMIQQKAGKIINTSSIWGMTGASCEVHYSAAKAAVIGMTKALAKELGPSNIQVNCVAPGVIDTNMNAKLSHEVISELKRDTPMGKIGTPENIAELVYFLASEGSEFLTGQIISPNGGILI